MLQDLPNQAVSTEVPAVSSSSSNKDGVKPSKPNAWQSPKELALNEDKQLQEALQQSLEQYNQRALESAIEQSKIEAAADDNRNMSDVGTEQQASQKKSK